MPYYTFEVTIKKHFEFEADTPEQAHDIIPHVIEEEWDDAPVEDGRAVIIDIQDTPAEIEEES